jgi:hypothetical protein
MPPLWRSRCDQRRTRRVDRYCSRASSTCSLPSKLRARWAKISRMSRSGRSPAAHMALQVALLGRAQRLVEQHFGHHWIGPARGFRRPCRFLRTEPRRVHGACRSPVRHGYPADSAKQAQLFSPGSKCGVPRSTPTSNDGRKFRVEACRVQDSDNARRAAAGRGAGPQKARPWACSFRNRCRRRTWQENCTGRPGTMVEMACL